MGPGRGGVSRGPGPAGLDFSGQTDGSSEEFEAETLPSAEFLDPESTGLVGVGGTAPTVAPDGSSSGRVETRASSGNSTWKRRVAPRHREAVQGFFGGGKKDG